MASKPKRQRAPKRGAGDRRTDPAQVLLLLQGQGRGDRLQELQPAAPLRVGEGQDPLAADLRRLSEASAPGRDRRQARARDGAAALLGQLTGRRAAFPAPSGRNVAAGLDRSRRAVRPSPGGGRAPDENEDVMKSSKGTQAILLQDVEKLGRKGDVVNVTPGYFRNYLGPRKLAEAATDARVAEVQRQEERRRRHEAQGEEQARDIANTLNRTVLTIKERAGVGGQLYGSVTSSDIADADLEGAQDPRRPAQGAPRRADQDARQPPGQRHRVGRRAGDHEGHGRARRRRRGGLRRGVRGRARRAARRLDEEHRTDPMAVTAPSPRQPAAAGPRRRGVGAGRDAGLADRGGGRVRAAAAGRLLPRVARPHLPDDPGDVRGRRDDRLDHADQRPLEPRPARPGRRQGGRAHAGVHRAGGGERPPLRPDRPRRGHLPLADPGRHRDRRARLRAPRRAAGGGRQGRADRVRDRRQADQPRLHADQHAARASRSSGWARWPSRAARSPACPPGSATSTGSPPASSPRT